MDAVTEELRIKELLYGPQNRELIDPYRRLGDVHRQWQQHALAVAACARALDISRQQRSMVDQVQVAAMQLDMAECHFQLGH